MGQIVIVIPAYESDKRLLTLLANLRENKLGPVVIVDDGSSSEYSDIFFEASKFIKGGGGYASYS